jgi:hypothetical protein
MLPLPSRACRLRGPPDESDGYVRPVVGRQDKRGQVRSRRPRLDRRAPDSTASNQAKWLKCCGPVLAFLMLFSESAADGMAVGCHRLHIIAGRGGRHEDESEGQGRGTGED